MLNLLNAIVNIIKIDENQQLSMSLNIIIINLNLFP